jgi:hypothetical protein
MNPFVVQIATGMAPNLPMLEYAKPPQGIGHQSAAACKEFASDCVCSEIRHNYQLADVLPRLASLNAVPEIQFRGKGFTMNRTVLFLAIAVALCGAVAAEAQCYYTSYYQPATVYYSAAPTTAFYGAVPTTTYYAAAPSVYYGSPYTTYYAPRVAYYSPSVFPVRRAYYGYYPWW